MHGRQAAEQQMHTKKYITQIGILNEYTDDIHPNSYKNYAHILLFFVLST